MSEESITPPYSTDISFKAELILKTLFVSWNMSYGLGFSSER